MFHFLLLHFFSEAGPRHHQCIVQSFSEALLEKSPDTNREVGCGVVTIHSSESGSCATCRTLCDFCQDMNSSIYAFRIAKGVVDPARRLI